MKIFLKYASAILSILLLPAVAAQADVTLQDGTVLSDKPTFIVTYVEAVAAKTDAVADLIREQAAASKSEDGNLRFKRCSALARTITSSCSKHGRDLRHAPPTLDQTIR